MGTKALVILSGGQDSTTCLFWARTVFDEVHAITFDYNQRHQREIASARKVAEMAGVASHEVLSLGPILKGRSPLTDPDEQLEQYGSFQEMDSIIGNRVELTFVPMRNTLFLTLAANRAVCLESDNLVTGVCQADNANYPDCREDFIKAMEYAIGHSLGKPMYISTPLLHMPKHLSVLFALTLPGCFEALAYTHTAYDGSYPPTGKDHATVLRAHAFEEAGHPDPLIVRAWEEDLLPSLPSTPNYDLMNKADSWPDAIAYFKQRYGFWFN